MYRNISLLVLLLSNLFPLYGIVFLQWNLFELLLLYWSESAVVGGINLIKLFIVEKKGEGSKHQVSSIRKLFFVPFFVFHYGMFMAVHFIFLFVFFYSPFSLHVLLFPFIAILGSHILSFFVNFLGRKEYLHVTPDQQMMMPYKRIIVMHLTIIFGGIFVQMMGAPILTLVVMVVTKTGIDIAAHMREHNLLFHKAVS